MRQATDARDEIVKQFPLVSVIMPLYNKRPYVERSIESIRSQTYPNWELIIVDDGSTDGSADVVPRDDNRIKLYRQPNRGPGAARNMAVKMASGSYLGFIDADDCYYASTLEKEIELLWNIQMADWMMSAYDYKVDGVTSRHYIKDAGNREITDETRVFKDTLNELTVAGWPSNGLFLKKNLFERLGGFNEEMRYGEITEFILRCAVMQPKIAICHMPLHLHISVPDSTAKTSSFKVLYNLQMGESLYKLSRNYPEYSLYLDKRSRDFMVSHVLALVIRGEGKEARKFLSSEHLFQKDRRWWKAWLSSWLPGPLLRSLLKI